MLVALLFLPAFRNKGYAQTDCVHGMLHLKPWRAWTHISAECKSATEMFAYTSQVRLEELCAANATRGRSFRKEFKKRLLRKMHGLNACERDVAFIEPMQLED